MIRKKFLGIFACLFVLTAFLSLNAKADDIFVPDDYPTVQAAIDAAFASGGGVVRLAAGTYTQYHPDTNPGGEMFPLIMQNGVQLIGAGAGVCILDAAGSFSEVIRCPNGISARIEGFTIINGDGYLGGGIACYDYSTPVIANNFIVRNSAVVGGGIVCYPNSSPIIANNVFNGNDALYGGALYIQTGSAPTIVNNTIAGNSGRYGAGMYCNTNSSASIIKNNIIAWNSAIVGGGIYCRSVPAIDFNDVYNNTPQNYLGCTPGAEDISADPEFVYFDPLNPDYTAFDFHLQPYSWCIDAGTDEYLGLVDFDFDGHLRPLDGDGDEEALVDIGADEVVPPPVARAGADQTVSADESGEATVTLDGTGSYDPGGEELSYEWKDSSDTIVGTTAEVTVTLGLGTHTFTLTVSNVNGTGTDDIEITVEDTTPPDPDEETLPTVEGECLAEILTVPTATDNCSGVLEGETDDLLVYDEQGTYTVTWTYTDESGNSTQQTQTVIVRDVTAPVPDAVTLPTVEGECSAEVTTAPTATDNCEGTITGTTTDPVSYTAQGTHTIKWIYNDGNGNITEQTQTVIVRDVTAPVPDVATLPTLEGECSVEVTTAPTATDNCEGTITGTTTGPLPLVFTENGTHTVTWTYDDGNGNIATQTQTVKVEDITPPTILLSESTCLEVNRWWMVNMLTVSASDNCSSEVELTIDKVELFNKRGHRVWGKGTYRVVGNEIYVNPNGNDWSICVTATATDGSGNTRTDRLCQPLLRCNRWSEHMARMIWMLFQLLMRHCHCW